MRKILTFIMMLLSGLCVWAAETPIPANPTVTDYQRRGFRYELKIDVPLADVDGNPVDKENLSYRLYIDGEPFIFSTSEYSYIGSDMAEIPWDYQDADGVGNDIMKWYDGVSDNCRRIFLYTAASTVGVESVYRTADGQTVSARYVYDTQTREGKVEKDEPELVIPLVTPANPAVTDYQRRGFMYELHLDVPDCDVDGNPVSRDNLSYRLYVDGEPFTFSTSDYSYIEADMAEIPWDYQDAGGNGYDIMKWVNGDSSRRIYLYSQYATIGVESVYRTSEGEAVSSRYVYDTASGTGYVEGDVKPTGEDVITSLPESAEERLYTLDTWMMSGVMLQHYTWSGRFDNLGFDGDDVYIKDICGLYRFGTYVKGSVMNDGTALRVPMMQHVFHQEENESMGQEAADVYLQAIRINEAGDDLELLPGLEYVDFAIDADGTIRLADGMGVAYVGHDGHLLAKNIGYEYRPFDMEAATVTPPADAESVEYSLTFSNEPDGSRSSRKGLRVVIDKDNAAVYVQGLAKNMSGWVRGSLEGDKVIFPSAQYVGTYSNDMNDEFAVYLNGAYATDEHDLFGRVYATQDNLTFTYDSRLGTMRSEDCVTETIGAVNPLSHIVAPELVPVSLKPFEPAVPANPSITSWGKRGFVYELYADIPSVDEDGQPLDIHGLVYRFYVDGSEEPFVFSTDVYEYIEEDMTDIFWDYQDQDGLGYDIMKWSGENTRRIYFYEEPKTIALETSYTVKGETHTSLRHVWDVATGKGEYSDPSGLGSIDCDKTIVSVTYTDIAGVQVTVPAHGLCIKTTRYADGTVKNEKVFL